MPRPRPPRKRPRRPAGNRVRAEALLNKQTAQSAQATAQNGKAPSQRPAKADKPTAREATAPPLPELWSRRSYAVLIVIVAVLEVILTGIQWAFSPAVGSNNQARAPLGISLDLLNPISLLVASLIAPFLARPLTHERRALRPIESLVVGLIAYFLYSFVTIAAIAFISPTASGSGAAPSATPCAATATCAPATATPAPTPAPTGSPKSGAATTPTPTPAVITGEDYVVFAIAAVLTYVLTWWVYPPLYKRLRIKPRPPRPPRQQESRSKK